ncbi:MAG TPA: hypothetical protein VNA25_19190 [Phycisphaerae bacterium]|nr:hypothetical protein [Phycisphaerae bacterium]HUT59975.1 hypothetical protein [Phycisphaerae bacterium]
MGDSAETPSCTGLGPAESDQARLVSELEAAVAEQRSMLDGGHPGALRAVGERIDGLLARITAMAGSLSRDSAAKLEKVRQTHLAVCLAIAAQKQDLADRLARIRRSKAPLRAYRGG